MTDHAHHSHAEAPAPEPEAEPATPTTQIKVQGLLVTVRVPFAEGHVLNAAQAQALNQTRSENLRNNGAQWLGRELKAHNAALIAAGQEPLPDEAPIPAEIVSKFEAWMADYDAEYDFSGRKTRAPIDPVEREAVRMASAKIREKLAEKKIDIKKLPDGAFEGLVRQLLDANPAYRKIAARRVEENALLGAATLEGLAA